MKVSDAENCKTDKNTTLAAIGMVPTVVSLCDTDIDAGVSEKWHEMLCADQSYCRGYEHAVRDIDTACITGECIDEKIDVWKRKEWWTEREVIDCNTDEELYNMGARQAVHHFERGALE